VIEAREHLKIDDGRLEAIGQLKTFIDGNALEVQQMQPLCEEHPWLIDHAWSEVEAQTTYTEQLRKHCKEPRRLPEEDRRIDILGIRIGGELTVVEIKRPKKTENKRDLRQIADYVDWARTHLLSTGRDSPGEVRGLLIVGKRESFASSWLVCVRRVTGQDGKSCRWPITACHNRADGLCFLPGGVLRFHYPKLRTPRIRISFS